MTTAIFGLIGVVVGGTITFLITVYTERRRENRQIERERKSLTTELRTAARLIDEELVRAVSACNALGEYWWQPAGVVATTSWAQHRAVLAGQLSDQDCRSLRLA